MKILSTDNYHIIVIVRRYCTKLNTDLFTYQKKQSLIALLTGVETYDQNTFSILFKISPYKKLKINLEARNDIILNISFCKLRI